MATIRSMTVEERRRQEEELNTQRQALLNRLRNEYGRRRSLDESINQQIQDLEGRKGDSQMVQLLKNIREYQQSLSASIDSDERIIAGIISDTKDVAEDNSKALEEAEGLIDSVQYKSFQTSKLKAKIDSIRWKQRRFTRLDEQMQSLITGRPKVVETQDNNNNKTSKSS